MHGAAAFVDCGRWTIRKSYNLYSTVEVLMRRDGPAVIDAKARHWSKIVIADPVSVSLLEYCHNVCCGKSRIVLLPDGKKILKMCSFVLTGYTNVTETTRPHLCTGPSSMALFTCTTKLDTGVMCSWAMAVHHAVGISRLRNSGYRPSSGHGTSSLHSRSLH